MIVRIVKMQFRQECIAAFTTLFEERKQQIRSFPGCSHVELWQSAGEEDIFFTYSHWESEKHLDKYRYSEFFKDTWGKTKAMFSASPQAWSVIRKSIAD